MPRKLGRRASPYDPRLLRLSNYLDVAQLPPVPAQKAWSDFVPSQAWGAMMNDRLGCCTCAAPGHMIQQWTAADTGTIATVPDDAILKAYEDVGGYVPGRPSTDQGANMLDVLRYWQKTGIGGHAGIGYVSVDPRNLDQVRAALYLFGGLYGGCDIYGSWMSGAWDQPTGGIVGGHAWDLVGYSASGFTVVTWGEVRQFTARGWQASMMAQPDSELFAVLGPEWTGNDRKAPSGFDLASLQNDLAIIAGQPLPNPPAPTPPQPPTPTPPPPQPTGHRVTVVMGDKTYTGTLMEV